LPKKRKKSYKKIACKLINGDNLIVDTTRRERFQVIEFCNSIRKYLVFMLFINGIISLILFLQTVMGFDIFSSQFGFMNLIAIVIIGFGNIICGLLLLSSE
jgi:hypothetical protein